MKSTEEVSINDAIVFSFVGDVADRITGLAIDIRVFAAVGATGFRTAAAGSFDPFAKDGGFVEVHATPLVCHGKIDFAGIAVNHNIFNFAADGRAPFFNDVFLAVVEINCARGDAVAPKVVSFTIGGFIFSPTLA